jgi:toxin-antitoxin system PIN domain toxin
MPGFTTSFLFPDINVWVALTHAGHVHHDVASDWYASLEPAVRFHFCRFTQLGFLRLLTAESVMRDDVMKQTEAWAVYDRWLEDDRVGFLEEPLGIERRFRALTRLKSASPKTWADAGKGQAADPARGVTRATCPGQFRVGTCLSVRDE